MTTEKTHLPSRGYEDLSRECGDQSRECGDQSRECGMNPRSYNGSKRKS